MKTRHFVLGLAVVLALSIAVPALGGPLQLRSSELTRLRSLLSKAVKTATAAKTMATSAQTAATGAASAANIARTATSNAKTAADEARAAAGAAQNSADGAKSTADAALSTAVGAVDQLNTVGETATKALTLAEGKVSRAVAASQFAPGGGTQRVTAVCPQGTVIGGGGFDTHSENVRMLVSRPEGNGWFAEATSPSVFSLQAWAMCLER